MEVATLVSSVLAGLSEENRSRCDRAAIMHVLGELGCAGNVSELQIMLTADADSVRDNLKQAAIPMFLASLKLATASSRAPPATNLGAAGQPMPSAGVSGVDVCGMISIKLGVKTVVDTHT